MFQSKSGQFLLLSVVIFACIVFYVKLSHENKVPSVKYELADTISKRIYNIYNLTLNEKTGDIKFPDEIVDEVKALTEITKVNNKVRLRHIRKDNSDMEWNLKEAVEGTVDQNRPTETLPTKSSDNRELIQEITVYDDKIVRNESGFINIRSPRTFWVELTKFELLDMVRTYLDSQKINIPLDGAIQKLIAAKEVKPNGDNYLIPWQVWESYKVYSLSAKGKDLIGTSKD